MKHTVWKNGQSACCTLLDPRKDFCTGLLILRRGCSSNPFRRKFPNWTYSSLECRGGGGGGGGGGGVPNFEGPKIDLLFICAGEKNSELSFPDCLKILQSSCSCFDCYSYHKGSQKNYSVLTY